MRQRACVVVFCKVAEKLAQLLARHGFGLHALDLGQPQIKLLLLLELILWPVVIVTGEMSVLGRGRSVTETESQSRYLAITDKGETYPMTPYFPKNGFSSLSFFVSFLSFFFFFSFLC